MNKLTKLICQLFSVLICATASPTIANAANATSTFPIEDAGMSAYVQLDTISQATFDNATANLFESVESFDSTYMIGVKDYYASDVFTVSKLQFHIYLDTNGWLVVSLLNSQEPSMMVNWSDGATLDNNLLKSAVIEAVNKLGASYNNSSIKYYDFSHPDATKMTLVRENILPGEDLEDEFTALVPGTIHQASYAMVVLSGGLNSWSQAATLLLDGNLVVYIKQNSFVYGLYDAAIFTPGVSHTINLRSRDTSCSIAAATLILYSAD